MLIDLQLHSTYSDGYLTPSKLVEYIAGQGVKVASLTDHNTVGGLEEFSATCKNYKIKSIPGIEIYSKYHNRKFNILWYGFNYQDSELHDILRDSQRRRRRLTRQALERLVRSGFKIDINFIMDKYNHYIPINRVVDDVCRVRKNFNKIKEKLEVKRPREGEIIAYFFRNSKIGKLQNSLISIERIMKLKKKLGGHIILCHPAKHSFVRRERLQVLKKIGLDGAEVLSPHHSYGAVMQLQQLTRELNLIETGGSDFHRFEGSGQPIQHSWDYCQIESKLLRGIEKIIG